MSKKSGNLSKSKLTKNVLPSKLSNAANSVYSGVASAQRSIRKPEAVPPLATDLKQIHEENLVGKTANPHPLIQYHPWEAKYCQNFSREKIKKSMTKDPYTPLLQIVAHAKESITPIDEHSNTFISANAVHIESPNIRRAPKVPVPKFVRYLRSNELLPSERTVPSARINQIVAPKLQPEIKESIPATIKKTTDDYANGIAATDRLLNRLKMRNNATVIRRPPRRLMNNIRYETIVPLSIYG